MRPGAGMELVICYVGNVLNVDGVPSDRSANRGVLVLGRRGALNADF